MQATYPHNLSVLEREYIQYTSGGKVERVVDWQAGAPLSLAEDSLFADVVVPALPSPKKPKSVGAAPWVASESVASRPQLTGTPAHGLLLPSSMEGDDVFEAPSWQVFSGVQDLVGSEPSQPPESSADGRFTQWAPKL